MEFRADGAVRIPAPSGNESGEEPVGQEVVMGGGRWSQSDWASYSQANVAGRSQAQAFKTHSKLDEFDPAKIGMRESRDSADNPLSTPIIIASDVTGSMGFVAEALLRGGIDKTMREIYDRRPVTDPHLMVMAVGDTYSDQAGLQVTQFEADIRIADQVQRLWLEGNGGGNGGESYSAAHLFAAMKTRADCFEKRGKKGYLFTVGDEPIHDGMTKDHIERFLGIEAERDLSASEIIALAMRYYEVFHLVVMEGQAGHNLTRVMETWRPLLPERTLILNDHRALPEVVISAIQVTEGARKDAVVDSWDKGTALVVAEALKGLPAAKGGQGVVRLG